MNRAEASVELLKTDRVGSSDGVIEGTESILAKSHDLLANVIPAALTPIDQNEYTVVPRGGNLIAGTMERTRSTLMARWFRKGNPLNVIPKALAAVTEIPDGIIGDILHAPGGGQGTVLHTAA